jgi:16S rRNA (guanine1207-N2)-methyltransferase
MQAISQIVERNLHRQNPVAEALWINPGKDEGWRIAKQKCRTLTLSSQDFGVFSYLKQMGANIEFSAFPKPGQVPYDWIILSLPRQKAALRMLLDCAASLLSTDGVLWLAGENKAGIKSAGKSIESCFRAVRKLDNARHCTLYEASQPTNRDAFDPSAYQGKWILDNHSTPLKVVSYPGVFAHGRLDAGTALLLEAISNTRIEGSVLDFACGAGVVGAVIATLHKHAEVTFLDNNAVALHACQETLAANNLSGSILASDGLSALESRFDWIVSNPPIHENVKTNSQLGMQLMDSILEHLNPGGKLMLVANIHLPYEKWLKSRFRHYEILASNNHFKVIVGKKPA